MKIRSAFRLRSLIVLMALVGWLVLSEAAQGFSISGVTLTPPSPVPVGSNIVMTVNIVTPSAPTGLYQPTSVSVQGNQVFVDVYPTSGLLTVIGSLSTNVNLGVFPGGNYEYEVRLHPNFPVNWGVRTNRGSFMVRPSFPWTMVTLTATDPQAAEPGVPAVINPGRFTVHRAGVTNVNLLVHYTIGGTASNGVDYTSISNAVFIPAGQTNADIVINPLHDLLAEGTETVALRIVEPVCPAIYPPPPECYLVGTPREATVYIADNSHNSRPVVTIVARDSLATEGTNCYRWPGWPSTGAARGTNTATFTVRRTGETNTSLMVFYQVSGNSSNGVDYAELSGSVVVPAGQRTAPITIMPVDDAVAERIETIVLGLIEPPYGSPLPSPYVVGRPARAAAIIVDNDQPRPCTGRLPDRCFHLTQPATNGEWFRIEHSANLVDWTGLCTNSVTDGAIHFIDPEADEATQRFYRAVLEPNPPVD